MNILMDEGIELIKNRVEQAVALIQRLKEENENLKKKISSLEDEIQQLKQETKQMRDERSAIKEKINTAASMLDQVDLENMLEKLADEVSEETKNGKKKER